MIYYFKLKLEFHKLLEHNSIKQKYIKEDMGNSLIIKDCNIN